MARCNCAGNLGTGCNCVITAGDNITVTGTGQGLDPYVITGIVNQDDIRAALSAGPGIEYDPATGVIGAALSTEPDNTLVIGPDDGLYVPATPGGGGAIGMLVYTGPGLFTKASYPGARWLRIRAIGGGGGGAGATSAAAQALARGGGSGGNYAESWVDVATIPANVGVLVGTGGTGGAAANGAGGSGGDTSFSTYVVATGGGGGSNAANSATSGHAGGGIPLAGGTGQILSGGERGEWGFWTSATFGRAGRGGTGGAGWGAGGRGGVSSSLFTGLPGEAPGGGGGGSVSLNGNAVAGADGADGALFVEIFG